ncbi:Imm71 family immunity protein [Dyella sp. ASV21]|uniref:Imm71 family immunity protein n=1 Tax=Dyella sp. ASV21 TaxID=2795114 RepID=UPI0018EAE94E|nr:Imm71 family immunity protein [Dyella sp. ASV21]
MNGIPSGIMLPNALERRQIFYWLKRISSYSTWRRILEYYRSWVSITEKSVSVANDRGWLRLYEEGKIVGGVPTGRKISDGKGGQYAEYTGSALGESSLIRILKGFAHAEEGVRRLRLGDKRVFQYNAHGEFVMADGAPSYWVTLIDRIEIGENTIDQDHTPHWDEFCFALTQLSEAWGESSPFLIEPQDLNAPSQTIYGDYLRERLPKMSYPNELPEVPDAKELTLVATGKSVPCSGIWEPVYVAKPKGFYLFSAQPSPEGPLPIVGCMSYLHAGSAAPRARQETEKESLRNDVTWRLLWRDDRYEDGTIPEEERGYVFQQPDPARLAPEPEELRGGMRVLSDEPCPYPGVWKCLDDLTLGPQTVAFGIPMPRRQGRRVMWRLMKAV